MLKKITFVCVMIAVLAIAVPKKADAAYADGASIGVSLFGGYPNSGLTLLGQFKGVPLMFGIGLNAGFFGNSYFGVGLTMDWWGYKTLLGKAGASDVHFYVGPGLAASVGFGSNYWTVSAGLRVPLGFSFLIKQKWEIFLEPAPILNVLHADTDGISILGINIAKGGGGFYIGNLLSISFQFGFRYWF
ncbi:hypothetical protein [uncultured Brachyspira sp.]|uniref:hypothetical protein n=1 Tax=uncultured Brachyspira sp. TaxID=221953 RepID=UPI0025E6D542|nr:hypothetical protein [uncultured Brachyspira sp.]